MAAIPFIKKLNQDALPNFIDALEPVIAIVRYFSLIWSSPSRTTLMVLAYPNKGTRVMRATPSVVRVNFPQAVTKVWDFVLQQDHHRTWYCSLHSSLVQLLWDPDNANTFWNHDSQSWFNWVLDLKLRSGYDTSAFSPLISKGARSYQHTLSLGLVVEQCTGGSHLLPCPWTVKEH